MRSGKLQMEQQLCLLLIKFNLTGNSQRLREAPQNRWFWCVFSSWRVTQLSTTGELHPAWVTQHKVQGPLLSSFCPELGLTVHVLFPFFFFLYLWKWLPFLEIQITFTENLCNSIWKANDKGTKGLSQLLNSVPPVALWQQTQASLVAKGHLFLFLF